MGYGAEMQSTMHDPRKDMRTLRTRIRRRHYVVDERKVADAMLARPMMRLFLAPPPRGGRVAG
jgi:hypothetical protein